ncbi:MAG: N-acetylmuramoyl-L-alanine amidase [Clostridiales bacterium]|nr:N-acetylmuramoyl-L-alanine amidase [Clostridiales bacterium]
MTTHRHQKFNNVGRDITDLVFSKSRIPISKRRINSIVLHCSATDYHKDYDAFDIDDWHEQRWGSGIGYHYVILLDGTIQEGRDVNYSGAHVKGHNRYSLGICYIGGVDENNNPTFDNMTELQYQSLMNLVTKISWNQNLIPFNDLYGHNEFPGVIKDCPCMTMWKVREDADNFRINWKSW